MPWKVWRLSGEEGRNLHPGQEAVPPSPGLFLRLIHSFPRKVREPASGQGTGAQRGEMLVPASTWNQNLAATCSLCRACL